MIQTLFLTYQNQIVMVGIGIVAFWLVLKITKKILHAAVSFCFFLLLAYLRTRYLHF